MARFEDYQKDSIEGEIQDAAQKSEDRQEAENPGFQMPERFQGKSAEEIAQSYTELEKAYSKQGNDLGKARATMDEYLQTVLQSETQLNASQGTAPAPEPVTVDDIYEDAQGAIDRAVEQKVGSKIEQLEAQLQEARIQSRIDSLGDKFGDWQGTVATPEFANWVQGSPYRARLAQAANGYDLDAAEELLGLYQESSGLAEQNAQAERDRQLQDATLEGSSAEVPLSEPMFSRSELLQKRILAQHGDQDAMTYLKKNAEAIAIAYEEGNLTD